MFYGETSNLENYNSLEGLKIQLFVKMQHPWVLHFDKKLYFQASQKHKTRAVKNSKELARSIKKQLLIEQ